MNKNTKILIFILILILIIGLILFMTFKNKNIVNEIPTEKSEDFDIDLEKEYKIQEVSNRDTYFIVKDCIEKFFLSYSDIFIEDIYYEDGEEYEEVSDTDLIQFVYSLLDDSYVKYNDITIDNFKAKFSKINEQTVNISKIYQKKASDDIYLYYIKGFLRDKVSSETSNFDIILEQDTQNRTYKLILQDYINAKYGSLDKIIEEDTKIEYPSSIKNDIYNIYDNRNVSDEEYLREIFSDFKNLLIYDRQGAYNKLDEEYRNKRFGDYNSFDEYVKENAATLIVMSFNKYQTNNYENYTQYVAIDKKNNYYIFNEKNVMDYKVILDQYTIDLPQFIEKYNDSNDAEKTKLNIEKIQDALNSKDYNYIYSKLDETFKSNNFSDYEYFKQYLKDNLYEKNNFVNASIEKQNDLYVYKININDSTGKIQGSKRLNIIMKLGDNTNYTISFNIE